MEIKDFHEIMLRTEFSSYDPMRERLKNTQLFRLLHSSIGLSNEVAELFKAIEINDITNIIEELGDIYWYIGCGCYGNNMRFDNLVFRYAPMFDNTFTNEFLKKSLLEYSSKYLDLIAKVVFHNRVYDRPKINVYLLVIAKLCSHLCYNYGFSIELVLTKVNEKLQIRYPSGFDSEKSLNRNLKQERKKLEE
jgi:NTP pyrophosphatase (non-canonical NTP hydrolase)